MFTQYRTKRRIGFRQEHLVLLLSMSMLGGCSGSSTPGPQPTATPTPSPSPSPSPSPKQVEVGGVTDNINGTGFRALKASGDTVTYATLGQGGHHIWGAIKVRSPIVPKNINVAFKITKTSDGTVLFNNADSSGLGPIMTLQTGADGFTNVANGSPGIVGLLCSSPSQCQQVINPLLGQQLTLQMSVKDSTGATGTDSVTVTFTGQPL